MPNSQLPLFIISHNVVDTAFNHKRYTILQRNKLYQEQSSSLKRQIAIKTTIYAAALIKGIYPNSWRSKDGYFICNTLVINNPRLANVTDHNTSTRFTICSPMVGRLEYFPLLQHYYALISTTSSFKIAQYFFLLQMGYTTPEKKGISSLFVNLYTQTMDVYTIAGILGCLVLEISCQSFISLLLAAQLSILSVC